MTRARGQPSRQMIDREYPYQIEMPVPEGGFGTRLDEMHLFHIQVGVVPRTGKGRYDEGVHYLTWCFRDPQHASAFQTLFGGELIGKPTTLPPQA